MRKKIFGTAAALCMAAIMAFGTATPAFAYADENADADTGEAVVVVEENLEETQAEEPEAEPASDQADTGVLTPEGNLTLVDDLTEDEATGLQFMTVTTKDGHYFYIIVDRSGSSENVYFLNTVDEVDMMALMDDEEKEQFTTEEEATSTTVVPVIDNTEDQVSDAETDTDTSSNDGTEKKADFSSSFVMLGVFGGLGALIAAAYYFLKVKPNKGRSNVDEDREFYDDDEYENEDDADEEDE